MVPLLKMESDNTNWITFHDCLIWAICACNLDEHLTEDSVTDSYIQRGTLGGRSPQARWDVDEKLVKGIIGVALPDVVFNEVKTTSCAKELWDTVKEHYKQCTLVNLVGLRGHLQESKCDEDTNVHDHFYLLTGFRQQLIAMGETVRDNEFTSILMLALPKSYHTTLSAVSAACVITKTKPTPDMVSKLTFEEFDQRKVAECKQQLHDNTKIQVEALSAESQAGRGTKRKGE